MRCPVASLVASILLAGSSAFAQEDVTPPVLLDFTIAPVVFDASNGPVVLDWCVTAADDLSGIDFVLLIASAEDGSGDLFNRALNPNGGTSAEAYCSTAVVQQSSPFGAFYLFIQVQDRINNYVRATHPLSPFNINAQDLCALGPCEIENLDLSGSPDTDNDGIPDDADNCPDDPNADQADDDLDLIGNVCDPFPNDRDNEKAQCFEDLAACEAVPAFVDTDRDGEDDSTDACPDTPDTWLGRPVDGNGCSQRQFCWAIDMSTKSGARICRQSDWRNDEPLSKNPHDCVGLLKQGDRQPSACTALLGPRPPIPSPPIP